MLLVAALEVKSWITSDYTLKGQPKGRRIKLSWRSADLVGASAVDADITSVSDVGSHRAGQTDVDDVITFEVIDDVFHPVLLVDLFASLDDGGAVGDEEPAPQAGNQNVAGQKTGFSEFVHNVSPFAINLYYYLLLTNVNSISIRVT